MEKAPEKRTRLRRWRRKLLLYGVPILLAWLALSNFVLRPWVCGRLADLFEGVPRIGFALAWPTLDVSCYGVSVETADHRLAAARVRFAFGLRNLFSGAPVIHVHLSGFEGEFEEGRDLVLFRRTEDESRGGDTRSGGSRVPPLTFSGSRVFLREGTLDRRLLFASRRIDVRQEGERLFRVVASPGEIVHVPFEKLSTRLMVHADRILLGNLKLHAFNGVVAGYVDVDTHRTGAVNGELEARYVDADEVWRAYALPYAEKRRGDFSGSLIFSGDRFALDALQGRGALQLTNAEFFSPLSFEVFLVLKIPKAQEAPLSDARLEFSFERSLFYVERAWARARGFELEGQGLVTFAGEADLEVNHAGTTLAVRGTLDAPRVKVLPLDAVTVPFDRLFRERVGR